MKNQLTKVLPFIILYEDIVFNYSFSLTRYSLILYQMTRKQPQGLFFINNASKLYNRNLRLPHDLLARQAQSKRHNQLRHHLIFQSFRLSL